MLQIIRSQFLKSRQLLSEQKGFTMIELLAPCVRIVVVGSKNKYP